MASFWVHVNALLRAADIIIEVLDARYIQESRNQEIEGKVWGLRKQLLYAINKCDLVPIEKIEAETKALRPSVFVSSRDHLGTTILKKKIMELAKGKEVIVGIVGYPNVGKSSLVNALAGRGAARISPQSGFTKGLQKVRVGTKILLLDTPGVFPPQQDVLIKAKMGAVDAGKVKDPEIVVMRLIEEKKEIIRRYYDLNRVEEDDSEDILEQIANKKRLFLKGKIPNTEAAARKILQEWQAGKIK